MPKRPNRQAENATVSPSASVLQQTAASAANNGFGVMRYVVKEFTKGQTAESVKLMSDGRVVKTYDRSKPGAVGLYRTERRILKRLIGCAFVPQLYSFDDRKLSLEMSYCGKPAPDNAETRSAIHDRLVALHKLYGVFRPKNDGKSVLTLAKLDNATVLNGVVHIIDFGSDGWKRLKRI